MRIEAMTPMLAQRLLAILPRAGSGSGMAALGEEHAPMPLAQQHPSATAQNAPATSVQVLVALAANEPPAERRKRLAKTAQRGLDGLDALHTELLHGSPSPERLRAIADWSATLEMPEDPALAEILAEIDLRVQVELAKVDVQA